MISKIILHHFTKYNTFLLGTIFNKQKASKIVVLLHNLFPSLPCQSPLRLNPVLLLDNISKPSLYEGRQFLLPDQEHHGEDDTADVVDPRPWWQVVGVLEEVSGMHIIA